MSLVSVANLLLSQAYVVRVTVPDLVNATATFVLNPHNGHSVVSSHQLTSVLAPVSWPWCMPQLRFLSITIYVNVKVPVLALVCHSYIYWQSP